MSEDENRRAFEKWISAPPYGFFVSRYSPDEEMAFRPVQYRHETVQLAWEAWCERGKLTGPVALEAQPRDAGIVTVSHSPHRIMQTDGGLHGEPPFEAQVPSNFGK